MYSSQLLKGTFETIILKFLSESESLYGYQLVQKIKEASENEIQLPYGSLYPILHKLEEKELVLSRKVLIGKRSRLYYSLTPSGKEAAQNKIEEFMRFARTMITLLKPHN